MTIVRATVRDGRLELNVPADWPDGIEVEIHPLGQEADAAAMSLDEISASEEGVLVLHMRLMGQAAEALIDNKDGGHADERETSVMLALEPRSVRMDKLVLDGPFEKTGATGDPSRATAFKGERLMAARLDDLVAALRRRWPDLRA